MNILRLPPAPGVLFHLGYPAYFGVLLGIWKVLGAIVLVLPRFALLKEWAYAGMFIDFTAAVGKRIKLYREAVEAAAKRDLPQSFRKLEELGAITECGLSALSFLHRENLKRHCFLWGAIKCRQRVSLRFSQNVVISDD